MSMRCLWCSGLLLVAVLAAASGCGTSESAVEGIVTLDGKPVEKATVTFNPTDGGRPAVGQTGSDGTFKLSEKVKAGTYKVTVSKREAADAGGPIDPSDPAQKQKMLQMMKMGGKGLGAAPKSLLPEKYESDKTTPFEFKLPQSGQIKLEMQGK
jgi:hypothetical protein